jgi:cell division protein FtsB
MKTKEEEKETLKHLNEISKLWNKIDKLRIENKMLKNEVKKLKK